MNRKLSIQEQFWKYAEKGKEGECWNWKGRLNEWGYGRVFHNGRGILSNRLSWMIHFGEIPNEMLVCHKCDNPACINPQHLWLGTNTDNMRDMMKKERNQKKLNKLQVSIIRKSYAKHYPVGKSIGDKFGISGKELAEIFGVCRAQISRIVNEKEWAREITT